MSIKTTKSFNETHTVYIGYYVKYNKILCISTDKKMIINYMENHRGLSMDKYNIEKKDLSDTEILIKYENYIISEYNGYYIPYIDQCIISIDSNSLYEDIWDTINKLKKITILSSNVKKVSENDIDTLIDSIKVLDSFIKKPKILNKLNKEYGLTNSILFCDIDKYFTKINLFNEMKDWDRSFNNALSDT